jgi:hypothetical protein
MTMGTIRAISIAIIIFIVFIGGFLYYSKHQSRYAAISTFAECQEAGYTVVNSVPQTCATPDGRIFEDKAAPVPVASTSTSTTTKDLSNRIKGINIVANQVVTSPLTVTGQAVGGWYFEASFPVQLVDGNGKVLVSAPATAKSDWMTPNFVPFSVTLSFAKPTTATGTLILRNDNPSGLPENQDELRIPVRFSASTNQ